MSEEGRHCLKKHFEGSSEIEGTHWLPFLLDAVTLLPHSYQEVIEHILR